MALKKVILFIIAFCLLNINKVKSADVIPPGSRIDPSAVPLPDSGEPSDDQRIAAFPMTPYATKEELRGNHPKAEKIGQTQVQTKLNQIDVTVWTEPGSLPSKFCREKLNIEDFIDLLDANDLIEIIEHYKNEIPEEVKKIILEQSGSSTNTNITRPTLIQTEHASMTANKPNTNTAETATDGLGTKSDPLISFEHPLITANRSNTNTAGTKSDASTGTGGTASISAGTGSLLTPTDLQQNESTSFSPLIQTKADASTGTEHTPLMSVESGSLLTPNRPNINALPQDVEQNIVTEDPEDCPPTDSQKCEDIIILLDIKPDLIKQRIKAAIEKQRDQQGGTEQKVPEFESCGTIGTNECEDGLECCKQCGHLCLKPCDHEKDPKCDRNTKCDLAVGFCRKKIGETCEVNGECKGAPGNDQHFVDCGPRTKKCRNEF